ncbi:MAG: hypothetical protein CM15mP12_7700 [Gammaproteobacteria bacterium]|nr:MAG: hypothetical protein CM15mP12_7700 [Gammaproteobacteria bacterium]
MSTWRFTIPPSAEMTVIESPYVSTRNQLILPLVPSEASPFVSLDMLF